MSLTKKDKEEIEQIVASTLDKIRIDREMIEEGNKNYELEQLDKKWSDGAKTFATNDGKEMIIATENYVDGDKEHFTWDEAMALEKDGELPKGWRLPNAEEWAIIVAKYGYKDGAPNGDAFAERLGLVFAGYWNGANASYRGTFGSYWSSSVSNSYGAYYLYFNSTGVSPAGNGDERRGYSVRCVKEIE